MLPNIKQRKPKLKQTCYNTKISSRNRNKDQNKEK